MPNHWTNDEEYQLTSYLVDQVCSSASGRLFDECLHNPPRDVYFIGNLRSTEIDDDRHGPQFSEMLNKLSPVAFGIELSLLPDNSTVTLTLRLEWSCYYRAFPTYNDQLYFQSTGGRELNRTQRPTSNNLPSDTEDEDMLSGADNSSSTLNESADGGNGSNPRPRGGGSRDSLFTKFRKINCSSGGTINIRRDGHDQWIIDDSSVRESIRLEMERASRVATTDPDNFKVAANADGPVRIPAQGLDSEASFRAFIGSLGNPVIPVWSWDIRYELEEAPDPQRLNLAMELVNTSPVVTRLDNCEPFLFDTRTSVRIEQGAAVPIPLYAIPGGWRYDRNIWARGINCNIDKQGTPPSEFNTIHAPRFAQPRYLSRQRTDVRFADLSANPLPVLERVLHEMRSYRARWQGLRQQYVAANNNWATSYAAEFDDDFQVYEREIERFQRGVELIRNDQDVLLAFRLTNETFARGPKDSWRLFQLVFLVSQIPGTAGLCNSDARDLAERDMVDIIYFPTGGGKTEAYLGTIIFHCFYDRLRGKTAGVTAWTRFPLRLLTLQQTQRAADVIGLAELVRLAQPDPRLTGSNVDGFAVGYFVGAGGSPNGLTPPYQNNPPTPEWSQANDPQRRQAWKRIIRCPACGTNSVFIDFDAINVRLLHRCRNGSCAFPNGTLPVYIVDYEIYRYLPSMIVGTIDKLASIGNQRRMVQLFGDVDGRCSIHGYYKGQCCQPECKDPRRLDRNIPRGLSGPTLFVQDELHLIKEGLGTFDAHYESYIQELCRRKGNSHALKLIASSATIEAFERQVEHLYGRQPVNARIFPGLGPSNEESFYAGTETYAQRIFVGILPHNKTLFNATLELLEYYHRAIHELKHLETGSPNPYGGALAPGSSEFANLLDKYSTSLTYFLANRDLDSIRNDLEGDVVPNLERDSIVAPGISQLTGSVDTDTVSTILENVQSNSTDRDKQDIVLATSMVSHGVDVDRFNCMFFYGVPRQNAEYIQASSRAGRTHLGVVFTCIHPARERDHSHYRYFCKYHEYLGRLVEPVAINRWSKFSIRRTLPGLVMATMFQLVAYRDPRVAPGNYYFLDFVKRKIADRTISVDEFIQMLEAAYLVYSSNPQSIAAFRQEIQLLVPRILFDQIGNASSTKQWVSEALLPSPMTSLRDVDEAIRIELDSLGSSWAARISRG